MAPGDQPSWLGGVSLFTRAWCPPDNPARACCPDKGPLLPQAWAQTRRTSGTVDWGLALGSNPLPIYLLMEKQQCRPDRLLLESMSLVSPFRKSYWPLFSFLWPSLSTGLLLPALSQSEAHRDKKSLWGAQVPGSGLQPSQLSEYGVKDVCDKLNREKTTRWRAQS